MHIVLLSKPTALMMQAVGAVSNKLLHVMEQLEQGKNGGDLRRSLPRLLVGHDVEPIRFGALIETDYEDIKRILLENDPENLATIMLIHVQFARCFMREELGQCHFPSQGVPSGKLQDVIKEFNHYEYEEDPQAFFTQVMDPTKMEYLSDTVFCNSEFYCADPTRGRLGNWRNWLTNRMGVLLLEQSQFSLTLPLHDSLWQPDAINQPADLNSHYVQDLIENDAVYVSGPSSMTALFLSFMELFANFPEVKQKQHYLAAVAAYLVSGGFHSLHEILGPAEYVLNLIPGYYAFLTKKNFIGLPPNFYQYYQLQMSIDSEFSARYVEGWDGMMQAYEETMPWNASPVVLSILHSIKMPMTLQTVFHLALLDFVTQTRTYGLSKSRSADSFFKASLKPEVNVTLLNQCYQNVCRASNTEEAAIHIQIFMSSSLEWVDNNSFAGYLLNALKSHPDVIASLNQLSDSGLSLNLNPDIDYLAPDNIAMKKEGLKFLKTMNVTRLSPFSSASVSG
jgi:hypothetical protein